ncbi:hypothetical protein JW935_18320 [candidate division KSB1 bacterium]|nr:hypothetical protein [candidate division KSB1 bacterium]
MMQRLMYLAVTCGILCVLCCGTSPSAPQGFYINLQFSTGSRPMVPSIFYPRPSGLFKTLEKHKNLVLCLHCDEEEGNIAYDCSIFENHVRLVNVERLEFDRKRALDFSGVASYAVLEALDNSPELDGTYGLEISAQIHAENLDSRREQMIIEKLGPTGGYALGISDSRLFFRIGSLGDYIQVDSGTDMSAGIWYDVRAGFKPDSIFLDFAGNVMKRQVGIDSLSSSFQRLYLGGDGISLNSYSGALDEVNIWTVQDYVEMDNVNVMVFDFSLYDNPDSLDSSPVWQDYTRAWERLTVEDIRISWKERKEMWNQYFTVVDDREFSVKNGMIAGAVAGTVGLNLIVVGASYKGELVYEGQATVMGRKGESATVEIELWPAESYYYNVP